MGISFENEVVVLGDAPGVDPDVELSDEARSLLHPAALMSRDIKRTASLVDRTAAGFLVDQYYREQRKRIQLGNQLSSLKQAGKSVDVIQHFYGQAVQTEAQLKAVLGTWAKGYPEGEWAQGILGIGPVLSAAFSAYVDIEKCPTVGHFWAFAGLDPTKEWGKGEKRPWNAQLKTVCWKIGQSFIKVSNREKSYYGGKYRERKAYEIANNQSGRLSIKAAETLLIRNIQDVATRACYEGDNTKCAHTAPLMKGRPEGEIGQFPHMPPGRINNRATRWTAKLYMAHWHAVAYRAHYGTPEPLPYPIAFLDHVHYLEVPQLPGVLDFPRHDGTRWERPQP